MPSTDLVSEKFSPINEWWRSNGGIVVLYEDGSQEWFDSAEAMQEALESRIEAMRSKG